MKRTLLTIFWLAFGAGLAWSADPAALAARMRPLLPPGVTLEAAGSGFREPREFLAAVHAAHNLDIPFVDVKGQLTGPARVSLSQAIHALRPAMSLPTVKLAVQRAGIEARHDLNARAASSTRIVYRISTDPSLAQQVAALLPKGMSLEAAAAGFRTQAQFLAALQAANRRNLQFDTIREQVVKGRSLRRAIAASQTSTDAGARAVQQDKNAGQ